MPHRDDPPRIPLRPGLLAKLQAKGEKIFDQVEQATVKINQVLADPNQQRLAAALSRSMGREVQVQVEVDSTVVGGLVVRVGDEVIDGSTIHRLREARRALASQ